MDEDGATSYRIPIWLPDGVNDLKPSLALEYNSTGRSGTLGPKWRMTGLSVIQRCPKTLAQDGIERPVDLAGDTFCLDGQRLVRQTGTTQLGTFRTELNPFQKIEVAEWNSDVGINQFRVYQPDGRIFYYGRSAASRLNFKYPAARVFAYYLDKIVDRFGNSILITYTNHQSSFTNLYSNAVQELFPSKIQWGGTDDTPGQRSVVFTYLPPSTYNPLLHQKWVQYNQIIAGEHLSGISIYGPDGSGNAPLLKQYNLTYNTPSITGEQLLSQVQECDGAGVCKRPTTVTWELGSSSYTRTDLTTTSGITDLPMSNVPNATDSANHTVSQANIYRRIIPVDLNRDGRDDIVYRVYSGTCTSWMARLATSTGSFGAPFLLPGGGNGDPGCTEGSAYFPYTGDIFFADLNQDGYPDMVSANGHNGLRGAGSTASLPIAPVITGYSVNYSIPGSSVMFAEPSSIDQPGVTDSANPGLAVGDINGDGYPDILRPSASVATTGQFNWYSWQSTDVSKNVISGIGEGAKDFALVDSDGDGIAELFRLGSTSGLTTVKSPTMNLQRAALLPLDTRRATMPQSSTYQRWMADVNADGVLDYVTVNTGMANTLVDIGLATDSPNGPYPGDTTQLLPAAYQIGRAWSDGMDDGARIVDFNLDGRPDMVLMGNGASSSGASRSTVAVLLSKGDGTFATQSTSIPIGDPADGVRAAYQPTQPYKNSQERGYRTSVSLDINGDDLPDFLQLEGGHVVSYVRQGKLPDMVTSITEGTGRRIDITYAPLSDSALYSVDSQCATDTAHESCLVRGRWLTKQLSQTTLEGPNVSLTDTRTYKYTDGEVDRAGGRGLIGFLQRDIFGPGSRHEVRTYTHGVTPLGAGYIYAGPPLSPTHIRTDVDTDRLDLDTPPSRPHHYRDVSQRYLVSYPDATHTVINMLPSTSDVSNFDCASNGRGGCGNTPRQLNWTTETFGFDVFGNMLNHVVTAKDVAGHAIQTDTDIRTYVSGFTNSWLVRMPDTRTTTSATATKSTTRHITYTCSPTTGAIASVEWEPQSSDPATHLLRSFPRDTRGRLQAVHDSAYPTSATCTQSCTASCNASCMGSCAGEPTCVSSCVQGCVNPCVNTCTTTPTERNTGFKYDDADGVYVSSTTDSLGRSTRSFRHPGYGFLVETDDPNLLPTVESFDTFGRTLAGTETTGRSFSISYTDTEDPSAAAIGGPHLTITPGFGATGAIKVQRDSLDREITKTSPVDASRTLTLAHQYDAVGRLFVTATYTGTSAAPLTIQQNAYVTSYDDLDRIVDIQHFNAEGSDAVDVKNVYDGLQVTTTDEVGHVVVRTNDGLGRLATQQAGTQATASFGYGPFGNLEVEKLSDGSAETDISRDVLGRPVVVTRTGVGARGMSYNPWGEVLSRYKVKPDNTFVDTINYGRDALGRVTSVTGAGINRALFWDVGYQGASGVKSIGKLVDTLDGQTRVHYVYDSSGRLYYENYYLSLFGGPPQDFGSPLYVYDSQGRLKDLYYQGNLPGQNYVSFHPSYAFDPYLGTPSSFTVGGGTMWSISARNDLGQPTKEDLVSWGGASVTRTSTYFLPTGQLNTQMLTGAGGKQIEETYTYYFDGLPRSFGLWGVGGTYTEGYQYDDLQRLTTWTPAVGGPGVTYTYDADGNLTQRSWSGETVNYSASSAGRTATVIRNGTTVATDNYQVDAWGRIFDTPIEGLTYNANDEVTGIVEKTNGGRTDRIIRDGLGRRVAITYGTTASSSYFVSTMNGLYEFKYDATTKTYEERSRFGDQARLIGDQVKTANTAISTTTFYLTNNVGSIIAEASNTGALTLRSRRDPYGNLIANASTPFLASDPSGTDPDGTSRYGFAGHDREPMLGLVDMNARFYSPRLGRFISPDSVILHPSDRRDYNPFAYVWDNPVAHDDPSGHGIGILDWLFGSNQPPVSSDGDVSVSPGVNVSLDPNQHGTDLQTSTEDGPSVNATVSGSDLFSSAPAAPEGNMSVDPGGSSSPANQSYIPEYETTVTGRAPSVNTAEGDAGNGGGTWNRPTPQYTKYDQRNPPKPGVPHYHRENRTTIRGDKIMEVVGEAANHIEPEWFGMTLSQWLGAADVSLPDISINFGFEPNFNLEDGGPVYIHASP